MASIEELRSRMGETAVDVDGDKIGKIGQIYLDDRTGQPQWVTISTGLFGTKESFAPLYGSSVVGDDLQLAVAKDLVKDAPKVDNDGHLDESEVQGLYQHYNGYLGTDTYQNDDVYDVDSQNVGDQRARGEGVGHDTSGPDTDDAMTRSEERLHVGTEQVESGRARLRKYVVTENVTQTVPVTHEEVRVEREPITDANRDQALSGGDITEEEHEVTLHAERPVVVKETVPVERVRLATETVTEEHQVDETVRKEQIDQDLDVNENAQH
jgi:uncharacterized protein (TIGR02271 family)